MNPEQSFSWMGWWGNKTETAANNKTLGNGKLGMKGSNGIFVEKKERDGENDSNGSRNIQPRTMPVNGKNWNKVETNPKGEKDDNLELIGKGLGTMKQSINDQ